MIERLLAHKQLICPRISSLREREAHFAEILVSLLRDISGRGATPCAQSYNSQRDLSHVTPV